MSAEEEKSVRQLIEENQARPSKLVPTEDPEVFLASDGTKHNRKGAWIKGQSGLPSARWVPGVQPAGAGTDKHKKRYSINDAIRHELALEADPETGRGKKARSIARKLLKIALDDTNPKQMEAIKEVLDRVHGKPLQQEEHTIRAVQESVTLIDLSDEQREFSPGD
jgi:hypothetical protein